MILKVKNMSRRLARDVAFKMIFEYTFSEEDKSFLIEEYFAEFSDAEKSDDISYVKEVYFGVIKHYDELCGEIEKHIEKFELSRLYKVDKALLLLAIYEIKYMNDIPFKVSVDEVVTLAKKYSTENSSKYINGILAKFKG